MNIQRFRCIEIKQDPLNIRPNSIQKCRPLARSPSKPITEHLAYLLAQVGRTVLTVVLYRYAESGAVYPAFPTDLLERSLRGSSKFALSVAPEIPFDCG